MIMLTTTSVILCLNGCLTAEKSAAQANTIANTILRCLRMIGLIGLGAHLKLDSM